MAMMMLETLRRAHAVPRFEGRSSHKHVRRPVWRLRLDALGNLLARGPMRSCDTFVQFVGFPRSGHSLVGSVLDAHPGALIAHELDAVGLFDAGLSAAEVLALVRANTAAFEAHGRYWNGHCYAVPGGAGGDARRASVVGDKKGDWAVRRTRADPDLVDRMERRLSPRRCVYVLVARNPFDNVATMSMRKGRTYDRLRIAAADPQEFERSLAESRGRGVTDTVRSDMVDDYADLCAGVAALKARTPAARWIEVRHEDLIACPRACFAEIFARLDLANGSAVAERAAPIVADEVNRTRHRLDWPADLRARVDTLITEYDFLRGYRFDD
jgi:hypothetical protein